MSSDIKITIEIEGEKWTLPVLPPEIQISSPSGNESTEVVKLGEITILKNRKLRTLQIDSFFPFSPHQYSFCKTSDSFITPNEYISEFERAKEEMIPARLTIEGARLNAFWVSIEDFTVTIGKTKDIDYSLVLKEYKPYGQRAKTIEQNQTLFNWDIQSDELHTSPGQIREPSGFAVGDRVIVSGEYYANSTGAKLPVEGPMNFLMTPFSSVLSELWRNRMNIATNSLNAQKCIIIDRDDDLTKHFDIPIVGTTPVTIQTQYRFCIADLDTRKTIGWVAGSQMQRM